MHIQVDMSVKEPWQVHTVYQYITFRPKVPYNGGPFLNLKWKDSEML